MTAEQLKEIISQMTLEEKAAMCSGDDFWHTKAVRDSAFREVWYQMALTDSESRIRAGIILVLMTVSRQSASRQPAERRQALTEIFFTAWDRRSDRNVRQRMSALF